MSMIVTKGLLMETAHSDFRYIRPHEGARFDRDDVTAINPLDLSIEALEELLEIAKKHSDVRIEKALTAYLAARSGQSAKVPNFDALQGILTCALIDAFRNGWIWHQEADGGLYPYAVTSISYVPADQRRNQDKPLVDVHATAWGIDASGAANASIGGMSRKWSFMPGDVSRRSIRDILKSKGLFLETRELNEDWDLIERAFEITLAEGFAGLYRVTGPAYSFGTYSSRNHAEPIGRKVIMDVDGSMVRLAPEVTESRAFGGKKSTCDVRLPRHPILRVFDLKTHEFYLISDHNIKPHVFDMSLRDKLVLPETHRDLLDVLTEDTGLFLDDFVEGKRAGNLILCKGLPGVGKTLTAEVYAEVTQKPLYSVHAGILGTKAAEIAKNLEMVFQRAKRWNCVLLIDEADVFVMERGANIENNAVVAEFLRTLEYFDGLLFMTTNRPDDIDDAILSRCAAILSYQVPEKAHARQIWKRMASNFKTELADGLVDQALAMFPAATGRDIKMLLSLSLRVSASKDEPLDIDMLRRCSLFRGMTPVEPIRPAV